MHSDESATYLVTGAEAARRLGLSRNMVRVLRARSDDFPAPQFHAGRAYLYEVEKIRKWAAKHERPWDESAPAADQGATTTTVK